MVPIRKKKPTSNPAKMIQRATPQSTTELHRRRKKTERVEEVICSRKRAGWENAMGVARTDRRICPRGAATRCSCCPTGRQLAEGFVELLEARQDRLVDFLLRGAEGLERLEGAAELLVEEVDRVAQMILDRARGFPPASRPFVCGTRARIRLRFTTATAAPERAATPATEPVIPMMARCARAAATVAAPPTTAMPAGSRIQLAALSNMRVICSSMAWPDIRSRRVSSMRLRSWSRSLMKSGGAGGAGTSAAKVFWMLSWSCCQTALRSVSRSSMELAIWRLRSSRSCWSMLSWNSVCHFCLRNINWKRPGPGEPLGEQLLALFLGALEVLRERPEDAADLAEGLLLALLEDAAHFLDAVVVLLDGGEGAFGLLGQLADDDLRALADGAELAGSGFAAGDGLADVALEVVEMALGEQCLALGGVAGLGLEGDLCGDGEDGRAGAEFLARGLVEVFGDGLDLLGAAEIGLLEDEEDVFFPAIVDEIEEIPRGSRPRIGDREDEEDEVGHRHEFLRDALVLGDDGIGAGGIDDVEIAQETVWAVELGEVIVDRDVLGLRGVLEEVDAVRGRGGHRRGRTRGRRGR